MAKSAFHSDTGARPAGYAALAKMLGIAVMSNWHESVVAANGGHRIEIERGIIRETFIARYWPGHTLADHPGQSHTRIRWK